MDNLKPCPKCNKYPYEDTVNVGFLWGCGLGCANSNCENSGALSVIKFALTKERAEKKAIRAWNRRANDG